eukprot:5136176-Amphidinium_carterae.1
MSIFIGTGEVLQDLGLGLERMSWFQAAGTPEDTEDANVGPCRAVHDLLHCANQEAHHPHTPDSENAAHPNSN